MSTLNQDLDFNHLPHSVRSAFLSYGTKVLLPAGTSLFRFSGHAHVSPWWSETSQLAGLLLSVKGSGQSLDSYIRYSTAVLRQWDSDMYNLIVATLVRSVYAFRGTISPQNEAFKYANPKDVDNYKKRFTKPVFFGGGNGQVYIPGLASSDLSITVPVGVVNIYDKVESILEFLIAYKVI